MFLCLFSKKLDFKIKLAHSKTFEPNYSPTQVILSSIFTYLGIRLCFYVYFQKN